MNKLTICLLFCLFSASLFCLSSPVFAQIGDGWEFGDGFTTGLYSNITISDITYTSTIAGSPSSFSASANSTATVTHTMWSSNTSGSFVNGSWTAFTANPITFTTTLGTPSGSVNTITLYVNDSLGTVGSNTVSLELTNQITASADAGVNLSPSGAIIVAYGGSQTFTYSAKDGYHITGVLVDGSPVTITGSYTFSAVTASHTFAVASQLNSNVAALNTGLTGMSALALFAVVPWIICFGVIIAVLRGAVDADDSDKVKLVVASVVVTLAVDIVIILGVLLINGFMAIQV